MPLRSYQIAVTNPVTGKQVDIIDGRRIIKLDYERALNDTASFELTLLATDKAIDYVQTLDMIYDIYRDNGDGILTLDHTFMGRYYEIFIDNDEREYLIIGGRDLIDTFLNYRIIRPEDDPAGANGYSTKSGVADTVMYEYVDEQCINPATNAIRAFPGLSNDLNNTFGVNVTARKSTESTVLEVLQELARSGQVDFKITHSGAAVFIFTVFIAGSDRTRTTNYPGGTFIIFTPARRNMRRVRLTSDRRNEYTVVYARAQGQKDNRPEVTLSAPTQFDSPYNYRETLENARNIENDASTITNLQTSAAAALRDNAGDIEFSFDINPYGPQARYNMDWFLGDKVTAFYRGVNFDYRISEVQITIDDNGEEVTPTLEKLVKL